MTVFCIHGFIYMTVFFIHGFIDIYVFACTMCITKKDGSKAKNESDIGMPFIGKQSTEASYNEKQHDGNPWSYISQTGSNPLHQ